MEKILRILRDKDIQKASKLLGVDEATLKRMNDLRLLNTDYIRGLLIKNDYEYSYPEIMAALRKEYLVKTDELNAIINGRINNGMYFCRRCGLRITKAAFDRTNGLCPDCFSETLYF